MLSTLRRKVESLTDLPYHIQVALIFSYYQTEILIASGLVGYFIGLLLYMSHTSKNYNYRTLFDFHTH